MKKKILLTSSILIIIGTLFAIIVIHNQKISYSKVVGEYSNTDFVDKWESLGENYSIGVNSRGYPIFKNTDAAFEQAKNDFSEGFEYLHKYKGLPEVSKNLSVLEKYKQEAAQANPPMTAENYEEAKKQCLKIAQFVDTYENSFQ